MKVFSQSAVDSVFIKANASMDSLVEKEVLEDASAFVSKQVKPFYFNTLYVIVLFLLSLCQSVCFGYQPPLKNFELFVFSGRKVFNTLVNSTNSFVLFEG